MGILLDRGYVRSMVATFDGDIVEPAALTALSLFDRINPHYIYTLSMMRRMRREIKQVYCVMNQKCLR